MLKKKFRIFGVPLITWLSTFEVFKKVCFVSLFFFLFGLFLCDYSFQYSSKKNMNAPR